MPLPFPTPEQRQAVCDWLTANGINPAEVCQDPTPHLVTLPSGERVIRYVVYLRLDAGADDPNRFALEERTAPLLVDPPTEEQQ